MTESTNPNAGPFYAVTPDASGVYGFATRAELDAWLAEHTTGAEVPASKVDPEVRQWHEARLAADEVVELPDGPGEMEDTTAPTPELPAGVAGKFHGMAAAMKFVDEAGQGAAKVGRCGAYGSTTTHFVVWPNTSGVSLGNIACPIHEAGQGKRGHIGQTVGGTQGRAIAVTKAYVKAIADEANAAKRAKVAAAEAAGASRKARDLVAGDVFVYSPKSYNRVELPTGTVLRVVATEKLAGGKVRLTVVGTLDDLAAGRGAYSRSGMGIESDLALIDPVVVGTISGTALVALTADGNGRRWGVDKLADLDLDGVQWADEADVTAVEVARLTKLAAARATYIESAGAGITEVEETLARLDAGAGGYTAEERDRLASRKRGELDQRTSNLARLRDELGQIEARIVELTTVSLPPAARTRAFLAATGGLVEEPVTEVPEGPGEEDTLPVTVCGNCLAIEGERTVAGPVRVTFDERSGRRLCQECEPAPTEVAR